MLLGRRKSMKIFMPPLDIRGPSHRMIPIKMADLPVKGKIVLEVPSPNSNPTTNPT